MSLPFYEEYDAAVWAVKEEVRSGTVWQSFAECKNASEEEKEAFFPPNHFELKKQKDAREGIARAVCRTCVVREDCLEAALEDDNIFDSSIRGGLNALELKRVRRQRANQERITR